MPEGARRLAATSAGGVSAEAERMKTGGRKPTTFDQRRRRAIGNSALAAVAETSLENHRSRGEPRDHSVPDVLLSGTAPDSRSVSLCGSGASDMCIGNTRQ